MIDEQKLIADIRYSEQWQNSKCPEWVIHLIESQAVRTDNKPKLSKVLGTMFDEDEYIPKAIGGACFHGEVWHSCPHCNAGFEDWDTVYDNGTVIKTDKKDVFICAKCGKKFRLE